MTPMAYLAYTSHGANEERTRSTLKNAEAMVREFMEKFGQSMQREPGFPIAPIRDFRAELVEEEYYELQDAEELDDFVGVADAIGDQIYVLIGYALAYGIPIVPIFAEIHRSNMTKIWPDGTIKRREDGKVLKPPTYSPADIKGVLKRAGWVGYSGKVES